MARLARHVLGPGDLHGKSRALVEEFGKQLGMKVTFEPAPIHEPAEIEAFINKVKAERPKGVIIFPLNADEFISGTIDKMAQTDIPTVVFCGLGLFHTGFAGAVVPIARRKGVYLPSTSDWELGPVRFGMKMIQAAYRLRRTKVAVLRGAETAEQTMEPLGLTIRYLPRRRFPDTLKTIEETPEVVAMAEEYAKAAQKVVEPTRTDLINAAKNYFASLKIMEEEGCQGISMDCLGLVGNREIPTPPCLSWTRLLDNGQSGTCEADVNAVMSQEVCLKLLDKPGFMQDPVPETERGTLIGVHCVCATKLNGWDQPAGTLLAAQPLGIEPRRGRAGAVATRAGGDDHADGRPRQDAAGQGPRAAQLRHAAGRRLPHVGRTGNRRAARPVRHEGLPPTVHLRRPRAPVQGLRPDVRHHVRAHLNP